LLAANFSFLIFRNTRNDYNNYGGGGMGMGMAMGGGMPGGILPDGTYGGTEATSLDWKSQCLENPSVPLLRLADKKSRIYRV
jgi:hypothetical protein